MIKELGQESSIEKMCDLLECSRSSYYYSPKQEQQSHLSDLIEEICREFPRYGYRRVKAELARRGHKVNHKRVLRILREADLLVQVKGYWQTTDSKHHLRRYPNLVKDLEINAPDQVWCCDITYIRLPGEFVYLAVVMDIFTRRIRGWELKRDLSEELTKTALTRALKTHRPRIHHSDQGVQYAASGYVEILKENNISISMAAVARPTDNAYVERLIGILKDEEVYLNDYQNFTEAYERIGHFLDEVYTLKRVHSSLDYLTPAEFEANFRGDYP